MNLITKLYLIIVITSLFACTDPNSLSVSREVNETYLSQDEIENIYRITTGVEPLMCQLSNHGLSRISGITQKMQNGSSYLEFNMLSYFAGKWFIETDTLLGNDFGFFEMRDTFEMISTDEGSFIYFSYLYCPKGARGCAYPGLSFSIYDLREGVLRSVEFLGYSRFEDEKIEGSFIGMEQFSELPKILTFIEEKAKNNSEIYRPKYGIIDWTDVEYWRLKWKLDNSFPSNIYSYKSSGGTVKFTTYKTPLLPFDEVSKKIENTRYTIVLEDRRSVVCYDREKKLYFPLWIETCYVGCSKSIEFENDTTVNIFWIHEKRGIALNLKSGVFELLDKKQPTSHRSKYSLFN